MNKKLSLYFISLLSAAIIFSGCPLFENFGNQNQPAEPFKLNLRAEKIGMSYCELNLDWTDNYNYTKLEWSTSQDFSSDYNYNSLPTYAQYSLPWTIRNLEPNTDYYIRLTYEDISAYEYLYTTISIHTKDSGPLDNLVCEFNKYNSYGKAVEIKFTKPGSKSKIALIKIYRKTESTSDWTLIGECNNDDSSYADYEYTPNKENYYKIVLLDSEGKDLGTGSEISVTPQDTEDNLDLKLIQCGYSYADLLWNYSLYDSYKIKERNAGSYSSPTVIGEYNASDLQEGTPLHFDIPYKVRANAYGMIQFIIECYKDGALKSTVKRTVQTETFGEPENLACELEAQQIKLSWASYTSAYQEYPVTISRKTSSDSEYEKIIEQKTGLYDYSDTGTSTYSDESFIAGKVNQYKVEVYDKGSTLLYTKEISCDACSKCSITFDLGNKFKPSNSTPSQFVSKYFDKGTDISDFNDTPYVLVANEYSSLYTFDSSTWLLNGVPYDFNTTISENIVLKAVYKPKATTLTKYLFDDTKFYLNWKNLADFSYRLEYGKTGETLTAVDFQKETSAVLENIEPGAEYTVNLYSIDEEGCSSVAATKTITAGPQNTEWLLIMYMDGDNNLNNPIYLDLNEAEYGLSKFTTTDHIRIIALWDGFKGDSQNPRSFLWGKETTHLLELGPDSRTDDTLLELSDQTKDWSFTADWLSEGEADMSSKTTLENYLNWVNAHFTGTKTILQFSNHGGGPRSLIPGGNYARRAMCWDDTNGTDAGGNQTFLKTKEVSEVLNNTGFTNSNKLSLIIEDVCLGSTIEEAYQYKDNAEYFIASPNTVPGFGLDYDTFVPNMKSGAAITTVGNEIVKSYKNTNTLSPTEWSKILSEYRTYYGQDLTAKDISLLYPGACGLTFANLSKLNDVMTKFNSLAGKLLELKDKKISEADETTFLEDLRDYIVRPGDPIYYQGSFTWLYDMGAIMDGLYTVFTSNTVIDWLIDLHYDFGIEFTALNIQIDIGNIKQALSNAITSSWRDGYQKASYDTTVKWSNAWTGNELYSNYYGLNVCGETIKIDANQIVPGNYPDFYATDLKFGADCSNWDALLKLWFPEE